jgi:hypothetical protein
MSVEARYGSTVPTGPVRDPAWSLGRWGGPAVLALILLALVRMAMGSFLQV